MRHLNFNNFNKNSIATPDIIKMVSNVKNDVEVTPSPTDGITDVAWSPTADFLAATSWDNQVNII